MENEDKPTIDRDEIAALAWRLQGLASAPLETPRQRAAFHAEARVILERLAALAGASRAESAWDSLPRLRDIQQAGMGLTEAIAWSNAMMNEPGRSAAYWWERLRQEALSRQFSGSGSSALQ